jgi:hypothetical protein
LWKGMAGRSWTGQVQEWGVPQVEALQLQKSIAAPMGEMGPRLGGDLHWKESTGLGREQGATGGSNGHAGGSQNSEEAKGARLV